MSRATHRRLCFGTEEIAQVERDGWWAKVTLVNGAVFKVTEIEPERIENERAEKKREHLAFPDVRGQDAFVNGEGGGFQ